MSRTRPDPLFFQFIKEKGELAFEDHFLVLTSVHGLLFLSPFRSQQSYLPYPVLRNQYILNNTEGSMDEV